MKEELFQELHAEVQDYQKEILAEESAYKSHILDLSLPIHEPKFLFSIGGISTIPAGELIGLKGRAKQGKSQFEYMLISVMLSGCKKGNISSLQAKCKVLLFDTEQSQASLKKCCQRALKFAGLPTNKNDERFIPFFLRPLSIKERKTAIENAIKEEKPDIVFIDGVRDLLQDFNDLGQSNKLIQWLLSLASEYGCAIVSVLHQNKSKEDGNMRGHLGTELLNKLTDCFEVSKKDGKFLVTCTDSRNVPCADTAFSIDANGWFQTEEIDTTTNADKKAANIQRVLDYCLKDNATLSYVDLVRLYSLEGAVSEPTAKRHIKSAKDNDYLMVSNGQYQLHPK